MSSKTFITISKQECQIIYKDILDNSDKKWEAGLILAEKEEYGGATFMAFISVEELVKSMIVFLDGKGFAFRKIKGIDTFFKNHQIRYILAYAMFVMSICGDELMKLIKKVKNDPENVLRISEEIMSDENYFEKKMKFYVFRKFVLLRREFTWFSNADIFRQDGLYCDYQEHLKTPISISPKDYTQVLLRLEKVRTVGKGLIEAFNTDEEIYTTQLEQLKNDFKTQGYYDNISNALSKVKQTRENPFELIKQFFG